MSVISAGKTAPPVRLVPMDFSHTAAVVKWRADPEIISQFFSSSAPTPEQHEAWLAGIQKRGDRREYVILSSDAPEALPSLPVGTVGLSGYTGPGGTAEYGILIGEARFRGRGVAREASRQILRIGFEELGLEEVVLNAFEANASAIILYEKLGFERDARAAGPVFKDGVLKPTLRMRLSHSRWHAHEGNECCRTS